MARRPRGPTRDTIPESIQSMFVDDGGDDETYDPSNPGYEKGVKDDVEDTGSSKTPSNSNANSVSSQRYRPHGYVTAAATYPKAFMRTRSTIPFFSNHLKCRLFSHHTAVKYPTDILRAPLEPRPQIQPDIACWWCCHAWPRPNAISAMVIGCPVNYDSRRELFWLEGVFCSWECSYAYGLAHHQHTVRNQCGMWIRQITRLLKRHEELQVLEELFGEEERDADLAENGWRIGTTLSDLRAAPRREMLVMFGGPLSIDEFRGRQPPNITSIPSRLRCVPLGLDVFTEDLETPLPRDVLHRIGEASRWQHTICATAEHDAADQKDCIRESKPRATRPVVTNGVVYQPVQQQQSQAHSGYRKPVVDVRHMTRRTKRATKEFIIARSAVASYPAFLCPKTATTTTSTSASTTTTSSTAKTSGGGGDEGLASAGGVGGKKKGGKSVATVVKSTPNSFKPGPTAPSRRRRAETKPDDDGATKRAKKMRKMNNKKPTAASQNEQLRRDGASTRLNLRKMPDAADVLQQEAPGAMVCDLQIPKPVPPTIDLKGVLQECARIIEDARSKQSTDTG